MQQSRCYSALSHCPPDRGVVNAQPENQLTPLHFASLYGKLDIAWLLLGHDATVNSEDGFGRTPLHLVAGGTYNFERDRIRIAQLLLERGADSNALDRYHATPLHLASYYGRIAITRALLDGGADANSKDNKGRTPLHSVAEGRYLYSAGDGIRVAQLLLERGADVNTADEDNRTPLHLASYHGRVEIVRVLLDGDATNSKAKQGWTPLHEMAIGGENHSRDNLRHGVLIAQLLLERGADVSMSNDDNQTPLHLTSYFGKVEVVLVLLNAGANASATNAQGQTPLHLALQCPYQGADYSQGDGVGVARLLLEHGTDVDVQDKNHATPLDLALQYGRTEIASLLLHHKDKANAKIDQRSTLHQSGSDGVQSQDKNCPPTTSSLGANVSALR
jgi:ankyrin repeat protein